MAFTPIDPDAPFAGFGRTKGGGQLTGLCPDNGTAYLQAGAADSLKFWFPDGSLFGVHSVDLAGYSDVAPDFAVQFVGYRPDGSTITADFSGSGLNFQTYYFGPEFSGLSRVEVSTIGWSLDNLVIAPQMKPVVLSSWISTYLDRRAVLVQAEGTTGLQYRLECSDDIYSTNWTGLVEFTTSYLWREPITSASPPRRFFRTVLLP